MEKVLVECKEAELLEPVGPGQSPMPDPEAAYEGIINKIRTLRNLPNEVKFALQSQNTLGFMEALKKLPYEEAAKILDDCVSSEILKLDAGNWTVLSFALRWS